MPIVGCHRLWLLPEILQNPGGVAVTWLYTHYCNMTEPPEGPNAGPSGVSMHLAIEDATGRLWFVVLLHTTGPVTGRNLTSPLIPDLPA